MKLKLEDIIFGELIGLETEIVDSNNKNDIGIKGKIIDETKKTLVIEHNKENKKLLKKNITLKIKNKNQSITIKGEKLFGKPKERIKK